MEKTKTEISTPGGRPGILENPPSKEVGPMDSGGGRLLLGKDPEVGYMVIGSTPIETSFDGGSLVKENKLLRARLQKLEALCSQMNQEIHNLKIKNEQLKRGNDSKQVQVVNESIDVRDYYTDEEELARETEWIVKKKRPNKKRKAVSSPETEQTRLDRSRNQETMSKTQLKKQQPPPINVVGIEEFAKLHLLLKTITLTDYKITTLNNGVWKINVSDSDAYRVLAKKLDSENIQWYSYENKQDRPIRVMARGLHASCGSEDILDDLRTRGYKILDVVNILKTEKRENDLGAQITIKRGLPLFMLTFENQEKIENIYAMKTILNTVVKIEPLKRNTKKIPQCKRCQGFNHTQTYCRKEPRCVKCAGKHFTKDCKTSRQTAPKCINCNGVHPANYRGCEVAKELQKRRNLATKPKNQKSQQSASNTLSSKKNNEGTVVKPSALGDKTFAQVVMSDDNANSQVISDNMKTLTLILNRLDEQAATNKMISDRLSKLESIMKQKVQTTVKI